MGEDKCDRTISLVIQERIQLEGFLSFSVSFNQYTVFLLKTNVQLEVLLLCQ